VSDALTSDAPPPIPGRLLEKPAIERESSEAVVIVDRTLVDARLGTLTHQSSPGPASGLFDPHDPDCAARTPIGLNAPRRSVKQQQRGTSTHDFPDEATEGVGPNSGLPVGIIEDERVEEVQVEWSRARARLGASPIGLRCLVTLPLRCVSLDLARSGSVAAKVPATDDESQAYRVAACGRPVAENELIANVRARARHARRRTHRAARSAGDPRCSIARPQTAIDRARWPACGSRQRRVAVLAVVHARHWCGTVGPSIVEGHARSLPEGGHAPRSRGSAPRHSEGPLVHGAGQTRVLRSGLGEAVGRSCCRGHQGIRIASRLFSRREAQHHSRDANLGTCRPAVPPRQPWAACR
jgi:hypothetical protein